MGAMIGRLISKGRRAARSVQRLFHRFVDLPKTAETQLLLAGRRASWDLARIDNIGTLGDVEFRVFSQWGEDGIIEWLVQNLPVENRTFIEFGVEDNRESNTHFLLRNRNWRGLVIDGSETNITTIRAENYYWRHDLTAVAAFITRENIDELFSANGFQGDVGLLSIDIDGNDYWVLEAIESVSADVLICEYNAIFGDRHALTIPYEPEFSRFTAHYSGLYFGASIKAVCAMANSKGYRFIGTCRNGVNAFFVRAGKYASIEAKITKPIAYPSRHRDSRNESGELDFLDNTKRLALISHLPVVLLDADRRTQPLADLGELYSDDWLSGGV
jgi:hypothetical protein